MYLATYNQQPQAIRYMPLPDGKADVWLCKNVTEVEDDDGNSLWTAEEVYFRTSLPKEEVEANFDTFFWNSGPVTDPDAGVKLADGVTTADRLNALEAAVMELAEVIANG